MYLMGDEYYILAKPQVVTNDDFVTGFRLKSYDLDEVEAAARDRLGMIIKNDRERLVGNGPVSLVVDVWNPHGKGKDVYYAVDMVWVGDDIRRAAFCDMTKILQFDMDV